MMISKGVPRELEKIARERWERRFNVARMARKDREKRGIKYGGRTPA